MNMVIVYGILEIENIKQVRGKSDSLAREPKLGEIFQAFSVLNWVKRQRHSDPNFMSATVT